MNKRVVIVEDEFFVANHLKQILEANGYTIIGQFHDGETLLENIPFIKNAVFLLDIQLSSEMTGINIAIELNKHSLPFIYITANAGDRTFENAIGSGPVSLISKPFKEIDVLAGVALAFQRLNRKITIETGNEKLLIDPNDVVYIKSEGNYVDLYLESGKSFTLRKQLKTIADELSDNFKRCHKSYIVNKDKVTQVKAGFVFLNSTKIPVSKTYQINFQ